jgi:hypothetical protein
MGANYRVMYDEKGITVNPGYGKEMSMKWEEVYSVSFYKDVDAPSGLIYLVFEYEFGEFLEISHDMDGFSDLIQNLSNFLSIKSPGWPGILKSASAKDEPVVIFKR